MTASDASAGSTRNPAQAARKVADEAFTAAWAGQPLSTEIHDPVADLVVARGRQHDRWRYRKSSEALAVSETLSMPRSFTRGNREIPDVSAGLSPADRVVQGQPRTTTMHASGKSDEGVVPTNRLIFHPKS